MEEVLSGYLGGNLLTENGLPTVTCLADALNVSPRYLGSMLRTLTGKNTQQHLHDGLIELAKEKLATTALSVSEIDYHPGFIHPQPFSKVFKAKTNLSPLEFRQSFN
jgi:AraC family transcriptional regulator, transcriptional activator of pobA